MSRTRALAITATAFIIVVGLSLMAWHRRAPDSGVPEEKIAYGRGEIQIQEQKLGKGKTAVQGKQVAIRVTGRLQEGGKVFFEQADPKSPYRFRIGANQVVRGLEAGVEGMRVGGQRRLVVPSVMGYGERGAGQAVPPNATLLYDVELLDVQD